MGSSKEKVFITILGDYAGVPPAIAAGISNHIWTIEEIVELVDSN